MRRMFCIRCGKVIQTQAQGPFKCLDCNADDIKKQPKIKGVSG